MDGVNSYSCACVIGYYGDNCEAGVATTTLLVSRSVVVTSKLNILLSFCKPSTTAQAFPVRMKELVPMVSVGTCARVVPVIPETAVPQVNMLLLSAFCPIPA